MRWLALTLLVFGSIETVCSAQQRRWEGTYLLIGDGQSVVSTAIDLAVSKLSFIVKPVARHRLLKTNKPTQRLVIKPVTDLLTIDYGDLTPVITPVSGSPGTWVTPDGETVRTEGSKTPDSLRQRFTAQDGKSEYLFRLAPDGRTLIMEVIVTSPRLPAPLKYALNYRRSI